jgi:hypothetical protein
MTIDTVPLGDAGSAKGPVPVEIAGAEAAVSDSGGPVVALTHRQIMIVFSGLMLGMFLAALDQTIVGTALPTIVNSLHGLNHMSWVVTAYLLTSTISTPLYGKLSDQLGRKGIFQFAIVIFLIGSALAGLSQNMTQLIAFRGIQGLGAGGLMAMAMTIIADESGAATRDTSAPPSHFPQWPVRCSGAYSPSSCRGGGSSISTSPSGSWPWSSPRPCSSSPSADSRTGSTSSAPA